MRGYFLMSDARVARCVCVDHAHDTDDVAAFGDCYQCACATRPTEGSRQ